jgi:LmbE family N-acetylglucosaminyl deacetylase
MLSDFDTPSPQFDPALPGTPESRWKAALEDAPLLSLPRCAVLVVSPHPDDEVLGAGGLIASAARAGRAVAVLSVTDGEAAYPDWQGLAGVRRREVSEALKVLAPHSVVIRHLSIPDGRVDEHRARLFEAVERRVARGTILVAPFERDGHPDHDATGEVCREIARTRGATLWRYPIWLWHHGAPDRFGGARWGRFRLDEDAVTAKARAMTCFASQLRPLGREPIVPGHVLPYFRRPYEAFLQ